MPSKFRKNILFSVYLLSFLFSLQAALPDYINSSYLGTLMSQKLFSLIYAVAAVLAIGGFLLLPKILRRFGNYNVAIFLLIIELTALLGLGTFKNAITVSLFMTSSLITLTFLSFSFDIFLEGYSADASTGKTRGIYLTCVNLAWALAPALAGLILTASHYHYQQIYFSAFILLLPVLLILSIFLRNFKDSPYQVTHPFKTIAQVWQNRDIRNIFMSVFLLQFFYCWMTIYTPVYLNTVWAFSWGQIGFIFSIMLLPFIFVQFPAGKLADSRLGEKEMLFVGFLLMSLATIVIFLINNGNESLARVLYVIKIDQLSIEITGYVLLWALILFATRIGAAVVEVMCDTYFFKKVDNQNANLISFYRLGRPLAYIIGPLLAILILGFSGLGLKSLFLILGLIMLFGLRFSSVIKDTK